MSVPDPTVVVNQTFTVLEDSVLSSPADSGLLFGATDGDGGTILVLSNTAAARGNVTIQPDGSFTYAPNPTSNGPDSFSFLATDGSGPTGRGVVTIVVGERRAEPDRASGVCENSLC